jgi:hypothetical protein
MSTQNIFDLVDTWNAGATTFTAIKMNVTDTASAAGSLLMDLQVGGVSQFRVSKGGRLTAQTLTIGLGGQTAVATNTALGFDVLNNASLTGANNVGVGYRTLFSNTTGISSAALGTDALLNNTTGNFNSAVGRSALRENTTGESNSAVGVSTLVSNTTGANNSAMGRDALRENTTGSNSTAVGWEALRRFVSSGNQVAVGNRALYGGDATPANNTGANNIGIGYQAGDAITTGSTNIAIGYDIDVDSPTASNQINIGGVYFHDRLLYTERADPAAPAANQAVVYARDNGAGKTQLCVVFNTGAVQVLATEP